MENLKVVLGTVPEIKNVVNIINEMLNDFDNCVEQILHVYAKDKRVVKLKEKTKKFKHYLKRSFYFYEIDKVMTDVPSVMDMVREATQIWAVCLEIGSEYAFTGVGQTPRYALSVYRYGQEIAQNVDVLKNFAVKGE